MHSHPRTEHPPHNVTELIAKIADKFANKGHSIDSSSEERPYLGKLLIQEELDKCDLLNIKLDPDGLRDLCVAPKGDRILIPLLYSIAISCVEGFRLERNDWNELREGFIKSLQDKAYGKFADNHSEAKCPADYILDCPDQEFSTGVINLLCSKFSELEELRTFVDIGYVRKGSWRTSFMHELNGVRTVFTSLICLLQMEGREPAFKVSPQSYLFVEDDPANPFGIILKDIEGFNAFEFKFKSPEEAEKWQKTKINGNCRNQLFTAEDLLSYIKESGERLPDVIITDINLGYAQDRDNVSGKVTLHARMTGITLAEELFKIYGERRPFKLIVYSKDIGTPAIKAELDNLRDRGVIDGYVAKDPEKMSSEIADILNKEAA